MAQVTLNFIGAKAETIDVLELDDESKEYLKDIEEYANKNEQENAIRFLEQVCTDGIKRPTSIYINFKKGEDLMCLSLFLPMYKTLESLKFELSNFLSDMNNSCVNCKKEEAIFKRIGTKYIY